MFAFESGWVIVTVGVALAVKKTPKKINEKTKVLFRINPPNSYYV